MGADASKESGDFQAGGASVHEAIDVATFEAEGLRMREISRMDHQVRSRFVKGVRYNMKIVVRGSSKTGKTLLWKRFQGMPYTAEIATINWTSPSSAADEDEAVKVEVWDVVDQAFRTPANSVNRISTADLVYSIKDEDASVSEGKHTLKLLDAQTVDVYRGASAVLFLVNPFDRASLDYVADQYKTVPETVCILLMLNFRDKLAATTPPPQQTPEQQVTLADLQELADQIGAFRSNLAVDDVTVIQTSLQDGFGLLHLHHYLDVPLLRLKQRTLQQQLARVEADLQARSAYIRDTVRGARYDDYLRHRQAKLRDMQSQHGAPSSAGLQQPMGGGKGKGGTQAGATNETAVQAAATSSAAEGREGPQSPRPGSQASSVGSANDGSLGVRSSEATSGVDAEEGSAHGQDLDGDLDRDDRDDGDDRDDRDSVQVQASSAGGTEARQAQQGAGISVSVDDEGLGEDDQDQDEDETLSPFCVSPSTSSTVALSSTSVSGAATPRQPAATVAPAAVGTSGRTTLEGEGKSPREVRDARTAAPFHSPSSSSSSDSEEEAHGMAQKVGFRARGLQHVVTPALVGARRAGRKQQQQQQHGNSIDNGESPPAAVAEAAAAGKQSEDSEEADL